MYCLFWFSAAYRSTTNASRFVCPLWPAGSTALAPRGSQWIIAAHNHVHLIVLPDGESAREVMDHEPSSAPNNPPGQCGIDPASAPKSPSTLLYKLLTENANAGQTEVTIAVSEPIGSHGNSTGVPSNQVNRKRVASGGAGLPPLSVDDGIYGYSFS